MRAQIMLMGGPWDMHLISYSSHGGEFPMELRVGSADEASAVVASDFHAAVYRRGDVENMPLSGMKYGVYTFTDMRQTKTSLVDVWVT
jgi:hypothetical protein